MPSMVKYPIYLDLRGKRVVLIGGGLVAARKAQMLLESGARLIIIAERIDDALETACENTTAEIVRSKYSKDYLAEATLAIAATNNHKLNEQIYKDCQQHEVLCNIVDEPELCDFFVPAIVRRRDLQIAIGTDGNCPAYAGHIRKKIEDAFTDEHGLFLDELEKLRKKVLADIPDANDKKTALGELVSDESFEYFKKNGPAAFADRAEQIIAKHKS